MRSDRKLLAARHGDRARGYPVWPEVAVGEGRGLRRRPPGGAGAAGRALVPQCCGFCFRLVGGPGRGAAGPAGRRVAPRGLGPWGGVGVRGLLLISGGCGSELDLFPVAAAEQPPQQEPLQDEGHGQSDPGPIWADVRADGEHPCQCRADY